jgi:hypothetical protein
MVLYIIILIIILLLLLINTNKYEHYTNNNDDTILDLLKPLNISISQKNIIVIKNNDVLLKTNSDLVICVLNKVNLNFYKFDINNYNTLSIIQIVEQIHDPNNIIIIIKKTSEIPPTAFFNMTKNIGGITKIIRNNENYILITNKQRTIYFELVSSQPIFYPYTIFKNIDCRENPKNILPPINYILYNPTSPDSSEMCAHESNDNYFGLTTTSCTPMTENEYKQIKNMPRLDDCVNNIQTSDKSMIIVETNKIYSFLNMQADNVVIFYELPNGKGIPTFFKEGVYEESHFNRSPINSIYIPDNYYLFLIQGLDIIPFYGPLLINVNDFNNKYNNKIINVIVQKHTKGNAIVCGMYNKKQICMTFGKGITVFHPKLFIKVLYIKMDDDIDEVSLFGDISAINLIDVYKRDDSNVNTNIKVLYPRVVRSIKVK